MLPCSCSFVLKCSENDNELIAFSASHLFDLDN